MCCQKTHRINKCVIFRECFDTKAYYVNDRQAIANVPQERIYYVI